MSRRVNTEKAAGKVVVVVVGGVMVKAVKK